jgi:hypothetical protein
LSYCIIYPEIIEIDKTACLFSSIIEQAKAVTHEMRQQISHFQRFAYWIPDFAIETVIETGIWSSSSKVL